MQGLAVLGLATLQTVVCFLKSCWVTACLQPAPTLAHSYGKYWHVGLLSRDAVGARLCASAEGAAVHDR